MRRTSGRDKGSEEATKRRFKIRFEYVILGLVMVFFAYKFVEKTQEIRTLAAQESALRAQNEATALQNHRLRQQIQYAKTPQYIENSARATLGYTKPGEVPVQIDSRTHPVVSVRAGAPLRAASPEPAWRQWLHVFFG